jgi:hypothetical protein
MINGWLGDESPQVFMVPARQYAKEIYRALLSEELCSAGKITIIVTYDLNILPLVKFFFPSSSSWLDFLNGVVLKAEGEKTSVGFDGAITEFKHRDLFLE